MNVNEVIMCIMAIPYAAQASSTECIGQISDRLIPRLISCNIWNVCNVKPIVCSRYCCGSYHSKMRCSIISIQLNNYLRRTSSSNTRRKKLFSPTNDSTAVACKFQFVFFAADERVYRWFSFHKLNSDWKIWHDADHWCRLYPSGRYWLNDNIISAIQPYLTSDVVEIDKVNI